MAGRLAGKLCFVTAAGQGIGRATALAMAAEGARVVATDRDAALLATLAGPSITTAALDVLDDGISALRLMCAPCGRWRRPSSPACWNAAAAAL
jgi:2-keto-3-deoxy-L-fuconate dehydrogenase